MRKLELERALKYSHVCRELVCISKLKRSIVGFRCQQLEMPSYTSDFAEYSGRFSSQQSAVVFSSQSSVSDVRVHELVFGQRTQLESCENSAVDVRCQMSDVKCQTLDSRFQMLDFQFYMSVVCTSAIRSVVNGKMSTPYGHLRTETHSTSPTLIIRNH